MISTYGHRESPYGIRAMFSKDGGESWQTDAVITLGGGFDLGYPCTVELKDGSLLTVYYAHEENNGPAVIWQQKWRLSED